MREAGGARPLGTLSRIATGRVTVKPTTRPLHSSAGGKAATSPATAGVVPKVAIWSLWLSAFREARQTEGDSSVSGCMARKSSVAEITGNSSSRMKARAKTHRTGLRKRLRRECTASRRHTQKAGTASSTQIRFSSNSMVPKPPSNYRAVCGSRTEGRKPRV